MPETPRPTVVSYNQMVACGTTSHEQAVGSALAIISEQLDKVIQLLQELTHKGNQ